MNRPEHNFLRVRPKKRYLFLKWEFLFQCFKISSKNSSKWFYFFFTFQSHFYQYQFSRPWKLWPLKRNVSGKNDIKAFKNPFWQNRPLNFLYNGNLGGPNILNCKYRNKKDNRSWLSIIIYDNSPPREHGYSGGV